MTTVSKYSSSVKNKVKKMRESGMSYGQISKKVGIPKSTLSMWLKDITLNPDDRKRLYTKRVKALNSGPNSQRERRAKEVERVVRDAKKEIDGHFSKTSFKAMGAMIYWAEGAKTKTTSVTNSDPKLILFMVEWFQKICKIPIERLVADLHIHNEKNDTSAKKYWSGLTNIPIENFGKSYVKKGGTGHRTNKLPYGIIRIRVSGKGNTDLRHRILTWARESADSFIKK